MRCIWEGDLRRVVDNVKLCVIIENLHFWAMNHLRPWLSSCVDQWRRSIAEMDEEDDDTDSAESDSSSNFAFRRAATLEDFVEFSDNSEDSEEDWKGKESDETTDYESTDCEGTDCED